MSSIEKRAPHSGHVTPSKSTMDSVSVGNGQGDQEVSAPLIRRVSRKLTQDRSMLRCPGSATRPEHAWLGRALTDVRHRAHLVSSVGVRDGPQRTVRLNRWRRRRLIIRTDFRVARVGPTSMRKDLSRPARDDRGTSHTSIRHHPRSGVPWKSMRFLPLVTLFDIVARPILARFGRTPPTRAGL
jgi:hypothetical protein